MASSILSQSIIFLVILVIILQAIHMILLNQIESTKVKKFIHFKQKYYFEKNDLKLDIITMTYKLNNSNILDSSGEYHIINNFLLGVNFVSKLDLTIVTQCSLSRLHHIIDLLKSFNGFISLSIFVSDNDIPDLITILTLLRKCQPSFKENVNIHLVYPLTPSSLLIVLKKELLNENKLKCSSLKKKLNLFKNKNEETKVYGDGNGFFYPGNLLRNVARRNVQTEFILVVDIDIIPSKNLREDFLNFIRSTSNKISTINEKDSKEFSRKTVFVLPVYEIDSTNLFVFPKNKTDLLKLIKQGEIHPFYFDLCEKCQNHTNYKVWEKFETTNSLQVLYDVEWKDPWEPFYIAQNNKFLPYYDERFRQYGFNRISQVCEMYISGYYFSVLSNHFLLHKGWKKIDEFHKEKDLELERNRILFRQFKNELKTKYHFSQRRCY